MIPALLFFYGAMALLFSVNALRRPTPPGRKLAPIWLFAVITAEAPWVWVLFRPLLAGLMVAAGALDRPGGRAGLWMVAASIPLQFLLARRANRSAMEISPRLAEATWWERLTGWPYRVPATVEVANDLEYSPGLTLDLYRPRQGGDGRTLVYLHGGSWGGGDPRRQFRPIIHHLAASGWSVAAIRYPLSPQATFPDHLDGALSVFDWIAARGTDWGLDPDRVAIAGGSAGAHLASLAALSPRVKVTAAVCLYGVYDFLNRHRHRNDWPVIPVRVMKATAAAAPDLYRAASPVDQAHDSAPPFLLVHGTFDSLVPLAETEVFARALEEAGGKVDVVKVRWGQHAFDIMGGARTRALAVRIEEFLRI